MRMVITGLLFHVVRRIVHVTIPAHSLIRISARLKCFHACVEQKVISMVLANHKILRSIVGPVTVDVVNFSFWWK